ncbi:MAG: ATP-grasp domain-containing protein [Patescibacteria group bacterium]
MWDFDGEILSESEGVEKILSENGAAFPVIHGEYGEDGALQKILEDAGIPFAGSDSESMALTIDKQKTGDRLATLGFRTPKSWVVTTATDLDSLGLAYPVIVKPKSEGSSVSLYKPASREELEEVLNKEFAVRSEILVQEFVSGREFTCGVVDFGNGPEALVPTEVILTESELFDYDAKYRAGACVEVTPAEVESEIFERIRKTAKDVHEACGCRDLSRTDMILNDRGELVVLEINTIPGMTGTSFVPAQLRATGSDLKTFVRNVFDNLGNTRKKR